MEIYSLKYLYHIFHLWLKQRWFLGPGHKAKIGAQNHCPLLGHHSPKQDAAFTATLRLMSILPTACAHCKHPGGQVQEAGTVAVSRWVSTRTSCCYLCYCTNRQMDQEATNADGEAWGAAAADAHYEQTRGRAWIVTTAGSKRTGVCKEQPLP